MEEDGEKCGEEIVNFGEFSASAPCDAECVLCGFYLVHVGSKRPALGEIIPMHWDIADSMDIK